MTTPLDTCKCMKRRQAERDVSQTKRQKRNDAMDAMAVVRHEHGVHLSADQGRRIGRDLEVFRSASRHVDVAAATERGAQGGAGEAGGVSWAGRARAVDASRGVPRPRQSARSRRRGIRAASGGSGRGKGQQQGEEAGEEAVGCGGGGLAGRGGGSMRRSRGMGRRMSEHMRMGRSWCMKNNIVE